MRRQFSILASACVLILTAGMKTVLAQEAMVRLKGNLSPVVAAAKPLERLDGQTVIHFSFTLPPRDPAGADTLLRRIYTPGDPQFHHFLKTGEYGARFGPTQADYDVVTAYARARGFQITGNHVNRTMLDLSGSASQIEKAFGVRMMRYVDDKGRIFRAPGAEPSVPASIAAKISGITDLDDALEPKCNLMAPSGQNGVNGGIGTGPNQGLSPTDIQFAYDLTHVPETGVGQTIALFELDGYLTNNIKTYESYFNLPNITVQNVSVNGVQNVISSLTNSGPVEVTLDIELAMALCSNISKILVYQGNSFPAIYTQIADDNLAQQVSSSWYAGRDIDESGAVTNGEFTAFRMMAMQGQTFFAASGDYGTNVRVGTTTNNLPILKPGVQDPSAQPFVTGVGGTTLTTIYPGGPIKLETAWSGSGGGVSGFWGLPSYQSSVPTAGSGGSSTFRNLPDVSLNADNNNSPYAIYYNTNWTVVGGTSCAAPLWAGFTALVNQRRAANGAGSLGYLNPTLYFLGNSVNYRNDFDDIVSGSNGGYPAVQGYDNVTGWGSFTGALLMGDLQVDAAVLYVDGSYTGAIQNGFISTPYTTVTAAVNAASASAPTLIYIKGDAYLENLAITKDVILVNNGNGNVAIGN